jgi:tRNA dimethylallyltransferase
VSSPGASAAAPAEKPGAIAIVGPTATGKTDVAIAVARELEGEVISLDSRQAYRGFGIGTAAPTAAELAAVPHHGVGFLDPMEPYGAGAFARYAHEWMMEIRARGHIAVLAGGTGFFLSALLRPIFREPPLDPERRADLRRWLDERSMDELREWARHLDPALGDRLERVDRQRASRTLELALLTGRALSDWIAAGDPEHEPLRARCFTLVLPPESHRERIEKRARLLLEGGWVEEVLRLREGGFDRSPAFNAVGYREVLALADGEISAEEAVERIVRATWGYARRQRTWFRHQLPSDAITLDALLPTGQLAERIASEWRASAGRGGGASVSQAGRRGQSTNRTGVDTG